MDALIQVQVKSGKRIRAKSLSVYVNRYSPQKTIKSVGSTGCVDDPRALVLPLYFASKVTQFAWAGMLVRDKGSYRILNRSFPEFLESIKKK